MGPATPIVFYQWIWLAWSLTIFGDLSIHGIGKSSGALKRHEVAAYAAILKFGIETGFYAIHARVAQPHGRSRAAINVRLEGDVLAARTRTPA